MVVDDRVKRRLQVLAGQVLRRVVVAGGRLVLLTGETKGREIVGLAAGFSEVPVDLPAAALKSRVVVLEREAVS